MSKGPSGFIDAGQCERELPGLWDEPPQGVLGTLVLAHGAGAPMDSPFMQRMAQGLAARGVRVVRFEFAYMAQRRVDGRKRPPNAQAQLLQQWREVHALVRQQVTGPLAMGGKSMGGRMASLLADELDVCALVCFGYPFYAAGKPQKPRVAHLAELRRPTLIIQGERDALGNRETVAGYDLAPAIELHWLPAADHDLKPLKVSGFTHEQHLQHAIDRTVDFLRASWRTP